MPDDEPLPKLDREILKNTVETLKANVALRKRLVEHEEKRAELYRELGAGHQAIIEKAVEDAKRFRFAITQLESMIHSNDPDKVRNAFMILLAQRGVKRKEILARVEAAGLKLVKDSRLRAILKRSAGIPPRPRGRPPGKK